MKWEKNRGRERKKGVSILFTILTGKQQMQTSLDEYDRKKKKSNARLR